MNRPVSAPTHQALRSAMDRLLAGAPKASDGRLTIVNLAIEAGVSRATAYRIMTDGTLPSYRFGGRNGRRPMVRVSLKELRAWLDSHRVAPESAA